MASVVFSNLTAIKTQRALRENSDSASTSLERLSSGMRINNASDDPGGLALADSLRNESIIATVAIQNANEAITLTNMIDDGLESIDAILNRMAELAEMSTNSLMTNQHRSLIDTEFRALGGEIARIASTAKYNNINLLSASNTVSIQVGTNGSSSSSIVFTGVHGTLQQLRLGYDNDLGYSVIADTEFTSQQAARTALAAVQDAIAEVGIQRGAVGANEDRLNSAISNLESTKETNNVAESKIRDVDAAKELANLLQIQILQQVQTAVLAVGPLQQETVTKLLT